MVSRVLTSLSIDSCLLDVDWAHRCNLANVAGALRVAAAVVPRPVERPQRHQAVLPPVPVVRLVVIPVVIRQRSTLLRQPHPASFRADVIAGYAAVFCLVFVCATRPEITMACV